jgi:hypothetical protein
MRQAALRYLPSKSPFRSVTMFKGPLHLPLEPMHVADRYGNAVGIVTSVRDGQQTNRGSVPSKIRDKLIEFHIHVSVQLGNIYVLFGVKLDVFVFFILGSTCFVC